MDGTWRVSRNMFWGRWELLWSVILDAGTLVHSSVSRAVKTNTECCLIVSSNTMLQWPREWDVKLSSRKYLDILCFVTHKYIDSVFRYVYVETFHFTDYHNGVSGQVSHSRAEQAEVPAVAAGGVHLRHDVLPRVHAPPQTQVHPRGRVQQQQGESALASIRL